MSKKFIVLDVEGMSNCRPYNIGYMIVDKDGNIYKQVSLALLENIWENLQNCKMALEMTHTNIQEILSDSEEKKYKKVSNKTAMLILLNDIAEHKVNEIWAYNVTFDKASLSRLFQDNFSILDNLVCFYDIIPAIVHTKLLNEKYVKWCNKNGFITEKGNVQVKAEIVYKYLTKKMDFEEEHTGLADVQIEYEILLAAINSGKKIDRRKTAPAWKVFKKFCEENEIEIINPLSKIGIVETREEKEKYCKNVEIMK